jgi:hypothetical protein
MEVRTVNSSEALHINVNVRDPYWREPWLELPSPRDLHFVDTELQYRLICSDNTRNVFQYVLKCYDFFGKLSYATISFGCHFDPYSIRSVEIS